MRQSVVWVHDNGQAGGPQCHDDEGEDALEEGPDEERAEASIANVGHAGNGRERERDGSTYSNISDICLIVGLVGGERKGGEETEESPGIETRLVDARGEGG